MRKIILAALLVSLAPVNAFADWNNHRESRRDEKHWHKAARNDDRGHWRGTRFVRNERYVVTPVVQRSYYYPNYYVQQPVHVAPRPVYVERQPSFSFFFGW
jgi:hypothetical protein